MSPDDKIKELISAVGSVAEMCRVFYDSCRAQGFTDAQAITLTCQIPRAVFSVNSGGGAQ
jgi:hypothetical protein